MVSNMWRLRPLLKFASLVIMACIAISIVSGVVSYLRYFPSASLEMVVARRVITGIASGMIFGLYLAIPMAIVTILFFREISKPTLYRWTMVTVALLVTIAQWEEFLARLPWLLNLADGRAAVSILMLAIVPLLQVFACHVAAGAYMRAALSRSAEDARKLGA